MESNPRSFEHRRSSRIALRDSDVVVFGCAISAGAHAALVPSHIDHEPRLGVAFVVAVGLLLAVGAAVVLSRNSALAVQAAALLFAGLIALYVAATTVGIPLLAPEPESLDGVAIATKVVEAVGLLFALRLNQTVGGHRWPTPKEVSQ